MFQDFKELLSSFNAYGVKYLVDCFGHSVTGKNPQAYARGYNPVREGGDFRAFWSW